MSIIVEYFTAPDDRAASGVLDAGPENVFPTLSCGNFLADVAMTEWESLLLSRTAEQHEAAEPPRIVADRGPDSLDQVFAASPDFQAVLAAADRAALETLARRWNDEYADSVALLDPDTIGEILVGLHELVRAANDRGHALYCWMC